MDADVAESTLLLAMGDSARLGARTAFQFGTSGRGLGGDDRVLDARGRQRGAIPPRALEAQGGIISSMRFLRLVLALAFGLAMGGPEIQACNHHGSGHHKQTHSTAPQACCPADVRVSNPTPPSSWTAAPLPIVVVDANAVRPGVLPARTRLLPFALAPPQLLA